MKTHLVNPEIRQLQDKHEAKGYTTFEASADMETSAVAWLPDAGGLRVLLPACQWDVAERADVYQTAADPIAELLVRFHSQEKPNVEKRLHKT